MVNSMESAGVWESGRKWAQWVLESCHMVGLFCTHELGGRESVCVHIV